MATEIDAEMLTNRGERMIVGDMWGYWAHLSIYRFALPFILGGRVLDAGSGAGYGAAYLARHGGKVLALDASDIAITHSRQRYAGDPVTFERADLNAPLSLGDAQFDVVFSSNVFEHVGNVDGLAAECARVLVPTGILVVAVPPICSAGSMASDMTNHFHVHHIPPTAWEAKLRRFFEDVRCHAHYGSGSPTSPDASTFGAGPAGETAITEVDFEFPVTTAREMQTAGDTITAVFVCRRPRADPLPETLAERSPSSWREGEAAARLIGRTSPATVAAVPPPDLASALAEMTDRARRAEALAEQAQAQIAALKASSSWRAMAPFRAAIDAVRKS